MLQDAHLILETFLARVLVTAEYMVRRTAESGHSLVGSVRVVAFCVCRMPHGFLACGMVMICMLSVLVQQCTPLVLDGVLLFFHGLWLTCLCDAKSNSKAKTT